MKRLYHAAICALLTLASSCAPKIESPTEVHKGIAVKDARIPYIPTFVYPRYLLKMVSFNGDTLRYATPKHSSLRFIDGFIDSELLTQRLDRAINPEDTLEIIISLKDIQEELGKKIYTIKRPGQIKVNGKKIPEGYF